MEVVLKMRESILASRMGRSSYSKAMLLPILLGAFRETGLHESEKPASPSKRKLPSDYHRQNGPRECARRRRQIEKGMLRV
jgi:hypothetical protein